MDQTPARTKNGRPLQNQAPTKQDGIVEAVPSRVFRHGTGILMIKLSHNPRVTIDSTCPRSGPPRVRLHRGVQAFREFQRGLGASPRALPANRAGEPLRSPAAWE